MIHGKQSMRLVTTRTTALIVGGLLFWTLTSGNFGVSSAAGSVKFPENHIELMKYWISPEDLDASIKELEVLLALLPPNTDLDNSRYIGIRKGEADSYAKAAEDLVVEYRTKSETALAIQKQRQAVLDLLKEIQTLYEGYKYMHKEEYGLALSVFKSFASRIAQWENSVEESAPYQAYVDLGEFKILLGNFDETKDLTYYKGTRLDRTDFGLGAGVAYTAEYDEEKTLRGYAGSTNLRDQIRKFWEDWKSNRFGAFELQLLTAEVYHQIGDYRRAQQIYDLLIQNDGYYSPVASKKISFSDPEKKFIRIRSAFNQIAWGDRYFKRAHGLPDCAKNEQLKLAFNKYFGAQQALDNLCSGVGISEPPAVGAGTDKQTSGGGVMELAPSMGVPHTPGRDDQRPGVSNLELAQPSVNKEAVKSGALIEGLAAVPERKFELIEQQAEQKPVQMIEAVQAAQLKNQDWLSEISKSLAQDYTVTELKDNSNFRYSVLAIACIEPVHNPLIVEACARAKMQIFKIQEGFNYLGYPDEYVPDQRYKFLHNKASEYADLTISAENRYIQFKKEAENLEYMSRQLGQNAQLSTYQEQVAKTRRAMADLRVTQSEARIKAIDKRIDAITSSSAWGIIGGAATAFVSAFTFNYAGATSSIFGTITNDINSRGEMRSLYYQRQAEVLNKQIAIKEQYIADLEIIIGQMQADFLRDNLNFLASKEMNEDLHYYLAKTLNRIKQGYLDAGIRMGYLAECALAFETGRSDLEFIKFDYELSVIKGLLAGDFLKQDLVMMENDRVLALEQRNHVKHVISLRDNYPIEFAQFLETGVMDFATSPYEFDKAYPGTYQRRLRRVEVAIQGLVGPEGFKGSLTNLGSFVVRSKEKTLKTSQLPPGTIPADTSKLMYGVDAYSLPPARLVLSSYDIQKDQLIFPPETEVREVFEGFGPSGLWRLEIPKNINDVDYRTIADVKLILYFDAYYDQDVEKEMVGYYDTVKNVQVKGLIQDYEEEKGKGEELDRIAMFSLRQHFPDEFFGFSGFFGSTGGEVSFELLDGDFPLYMTDKKVKKVIVRAVDENGGGIKGLKVQIKKLTNPANSLDLQETTLGDGYTVDLKAGNISLLDKSRRVPIVGTWSVKVDDFSKVYDLLVFFMYEYEEKKTVL